jgi:hypothetical protein
VFEVIAPEIGRLHIRDVQVQLGRNASGRRAVTAVVLQCRAVLEFNVSLLPKRGARGRSLLECPTCRKGKLVLRVSDTGRLGCNRCVRHLTRRQRERACVAWRRGGAEADALVRRALRQAPACFKAVALATLASKVLAADRAHADRAARDAHAALAAADEVDRPQRVEER